ncbi:MAG: formylglycine-generating enzyme family protein [Nitrospinota bacterium]
MAWPKGLRLLALGGLLLFLAGGGGSGPLDRHEVTNREYKAYLDATAKPAPEYWAKGTFPAGMGEEPVVLVTWFEARDYCAWAGKRLPRAEEWLQACRAKAIEKRGDIWEWTTSPAEGPEGAGFKVLCDPGGGCSCTHRYHPSWKNMVKGFRCARGEPLVRR